MKCKNKYRRLCCISILFFCITSVSVGNVFSEDVAAPAKTVVDAFELSPETVEQAVTTIWNFELWSIGGQVITVKEAVSALLILVLGIFIIKFICWFIRKRLSASPRITKNTALIIQKISFYFLLVFVLLFALKTLNIPLTAFAFLGGALAIGIGFGTQTIMSNFISGFILMAERPVRVGDLIELEDKFATVEEVGVRCTRIRTADNVHILVPNSKFLDQNIINWTLSDKQVRVTITIGVAYGSPVREVEKLLLEAVEKHSDANKVPEPWVRFNDFGDNALIFNIYFWVDMKNLTERIRIASDIRFYIDASFRDAGIVIAFPQRDIHLDTLKPLDIRILEQERKSN